MAKRKSKRKKPLSEAQKTALRATFTTAQAERWAYVQDAKRAGAARGLETRKQAAALAAAERSKTSWDRELAAHPHWQPEAAQIKRARNYDVTGFLEYILGGNISIPYRTASGEGRAGSGPLVPRLWQMKIGRELIEHRLTSRTRWLELAVKGRQRGLSVWWDASIWADSEKNPGIQSAVSAHQDKTLKALNQNFRTFAGRKKEAGKAERMADAMLETKGGSTVSLLGAGDSLGRGGALTHVHVSEADYIEDLNDALDSVLASMVKAPWATAMLETTIRRGSNTEFKDFIEDTVKEQERLRVKGDSAISWMEDAWKVRFLSWLEDETAIVTLSPSEAAEFMDSIESSDNRARDYERQLRDQHKCTPGQIAWWRIMWASDARRNLLRMIEMYPTSLDEALKLVSTASFFSRDSLDFYRSMCREPVERYLVSYDGMKVTPHVTGPVMSLWHQPVSRYNYVIGADSADADTRIADKGSECYAVVLEVETGRQMAEFHGYCNTHEFAMVLWRMAMWFNDALVVPEVPVGGGGVVDALTHTFQYTKIYEREQFGATQERIVGTFGFDTKSGSRKVIVGRLQDNFNSRTLNIYSHYLLDQLVEFGKRGGAAQKKQQKIGQMPDDGCMALALCMAGHENATNGAWLPKDVDGHNEENPRDVVMYGERAEAARQSLIVGVQPDDMDYIRWRRRQEADVNEAILFDG